MASASDSVNESADVQGETVTSGTTRLRRRIAIALTLVVALFVVVQGYLAYTALAQQEDELVDSVVEKETRRLVNRLLAGEEIFPADGAAVDVTARFKAWLLPAHPLLGGDPAHWPPAHIRGLPDGAHLRRESWRELHYLVTETPRGRLIVEYDASEDEAFVYRFGAYLVVTGLIFIVLAAIVSVAIARILVEPFTRMAVHLSKWAPGAPPVLVGRTDEETLLLEAFEAAQRRLEESHAREREFAANVRHEIRTPLTALRTDAEMLILTQPVDDAGRQRLARMKNTIDAIAADIEALHGLSQARPAKPEPVDLAACVDIVWTGLQHRNADGRLTLLNRIPRDSRLVVDRLGLMTILRNLLRNAIDHASPGRCLVERTPTGLQLTDNGPGIAAEDLPRIFDRHFSRRRADSQAASPMREDATASESDGAERGLGLAIARQTALIRGWTLTVESRLGHGSCFKLALVDAATEEPTRSAEEAPPGEDPRAAPGACT